MSIAVMKQALEVLNLELPIGSHLELKNALRDAIEQAQPDTRAHHKMMIAMMQMHWRRIDPQWKNDPELCHAMGYEAGYNDAVARRVEPRLGGSGAGFESLPASPNQPEQESPITHNHLWIGDLYGREKNT